MSYVRKRALLACDFCRHRKRRCTGEQPCSTCVESNAECHYKELPVDRIESPSASNDAIAERLGRIESLLEEQAHQLQILAVNSQSASGGVLPVTVSSDAASRASRARTGSPGEEGSHSPPFFGANLFPYDPAPAGLSTSSSTSSVPTVLVPPDHAHHVPQNVARQGSSGSLSLPLAALPPRSRPPHSLPPPPPPLAGFVESVTAYDHVTTDVTPSPRTDSAAVTTQYPYAYNLTQQQQQRSAQGHNDEKEQYSFLIPLDHSTAANTLLSLPLVRHFLIQRHASLFPTAYDEDDPTHPPTVRHPRRPSFAYSRSYFFDIESAHPLPPLLDLDRDLDELVGPSVSAPPNGDLRLWWPRPDLRASLTAAYFARVHPSAPLFGNTVFRQWDAAEEQVWQDNRPSGRAGLDSDIGDHGGKKTRAGTPTIRTAICLAVWALGALVGGGDVHKNEVDNNNQAAREHLAMVLFRPAFKILLHHALWELDLATLGIGQALLLAASFFSHMGRPLHSARLVYLANRHLLRLLEEQRRQGREPDQDDDIVRVLWIGFILECDRAAELHVPRSGIEPLADHMPLPGSLDPNDANESDNMICFVAEIAVRRLLNRIHSSLYASSSPSSAPSFSPMSSMTGVRPRKPPPMAATAAATTTSALETAVGSGKGSMIPPGSKRKHRHDSESHSARSYSTATVPTPPLPPLPSSLSSPLPPPPPTDTSIAKMISISAELNRQLEDWYQTIPRALRPPLLDAEAVSAARGHTASPPQTASSSSRNERVRILRIHYYAALHLIYRPFVLHVAWQRATARSAPYPPSQDDDEKGDSDRETGDGENNDAIDSIENKSNDNDNDDDETDDKKHPHSASSLILAHCAVCVDACTAYLVHVLPLLAHRSPYLWSLCQGSMACLLVLLVADACPEIVSWRRHRKRRQQHQHGEGKTNIAPLDLGWLCDQVAGQLRRWATPGSSFAAELAIIEQLPVRRVQNAEQKMRRPQTD